MSSATLHEGLVDSCVEFLERYYREDIVRLAHLWPDEQSLWIDWQDLWQYDPDLAEDLIDVPADVFEHLETAVPDVDHPVGTELTDVTVRIRNLSEEYVHAPGELRK